MKLSLVQTKVLYWIATTIVVVLPIISWQDRLGQGSFSFSDITALNTFPLLGLLAFSLMWIHFAGYFFKMIAHPEYDSKRWYRQTSNVVLVLILLHPALLLWKGNELGFSAADYVGPNNTWALYFAYLALAGFIIWEFVEWFRKSAFVKKNIELLSLINNIAFVLIFFHGLKLGQHLGSGWLRYIWLFYGFSGILVVILAYLDKINSQTDPSKD